MQNFHNKSAGIEVKFALQESSIQIGKLQVRLPILTNLINFQKRSVCALTTGSDILALKELMRSPHSKLIAIAVSAHVIRGHSGQCVCIFYLPVTLWFVFMWPPLCFFLLRYCHHGSACFAFPFIHYFTISESLCTEISLSLMTMILLAVSRYKWVWISVISTSKSWQLEMLTMCLRCKLHYKHTAYKTIFFKSTKKLTQKSF